MQIVHQYIPQQQVQYIQTQPAYSPYGQPLDTEMVYLNQQQYSKPEAPLAQLVQEEIHKA